MRTRQRTKRGSRKTGRLSYVPTYSFMHSLMKATSAKKTMRCSRLGHSRGSEPFVKLVSSRQCTHYEWRDESLLCAPSKKVRIQAQCACAKHYIGGATVAAFMALVHRRNNFVHAINWSQRQNMLTTMTITRQRRQVSRCSRNITFLAFSPQAVPPLPCVYI